MPTGPTGSNPVARIARDDQWRFLYGGMMEEKEGKEPTAETLTALCILGGRVIRRSCVANRYSRPISACPACGCVTPLRDSKGNDLDCVLS